MDTNLFVPDEIDAVSIRLDDDRGTTLSSLTYDLRGDGPVLPLFFELKPTDGEPADAKRSLTVSALKGGVAVLRRDQEFQFVPGRSRGLHVELVAGCLVRACGANETCGNDGLCGARVVDLRNGVDVDQAIPPRTPREAVDTMPAVSVDAGIDASPDVVEAVDLAAPPPPPPDPCASDNGGCDPHARCAAADDQSTSCTCGPGWKGDGRSCTEAVAPTVTSTTPRNGDRGVFRAGEIEIVFSEPMDAATVGAALQVATQAGPKQGSVSWNPDGTRVLWTPATPFVYNDVVRFSVGVDAADLAGNHLASAFSASYSITRRATTHVIAGDPYGSVSSDGVVLDRQLEVGESKLNGEREIRSFLTFDLTDVPVGAVVINADLRLWVSRGCDDGQGVGVLSKLGGILAELIKQEAPLDGGAFDRPALAPQTGPPAVALIQPDVGNGRRIGASLTEQVARALSSRSPSQRGATVRLRSVTGAVVDGSSWNCPMSGPLDIGEEPILDIDYEYR